MSSGNPFEPRIVTSEKKPGRGARFLPSLIPASVAVMVTLLVWSVLITTLDPLLPIELAMPTWSLTLVLACGAGTRSMISFWPKATHSWAFALVFASFSAVYIVGQWNHAGNKSVWTLAWIYGTLALLPLLAFDQATRQAKLKKPNQRPG